MHDKPTRNGWQHLCADAVNRISTRLKFPNSKRFSNDLREFFLSFTR